MRGQVATKGKLVSNYFWVVPWMLERESRGVLEYRGWEWGRQTVICVVRA